MQAKVWAVGDGCTDLTVTPHPSSIYLSRVLTSHFMKLCKQEPQCILVESLNP